MTDTLLASFVSSLDMVVFERLPNSVFMQVTSSPSWFTHAFGDASQGQPITLSQAFPFLDAFLTDAEAHWQEHGPVALRSEAFTVTTPEGEVLLRAAASTVGRRQLLSIERLVGLADPRLLLQLAREKDLRHERIDRLLESVRASSTALQQAADRLVDAGLTPAQLEAVQAVRQLSARIEEALRRAAPDAAPR